MMWQRRLTPALRPESSKPLYNPDRGWYEMERFQLGEETPAPVCQPLHALTLLEVNLAAYRDCALSDLALGQLEALLQSLRQSGCHAILRPLYDWDGQCFLHEPERVEQVCAHIRQLAPLLHAYAEEIFLLQGMLVGNWAEMHGSRHLAPDSLRRLFDALTEAVGPGTYLAVRTPSFWRTCVRCGDPDPVDAAALRLGVFDDALCSSETDLDTFGAEDAVPGSYTHKRPPAEERRFIALLARHAPFGGETAAPHACNEGNAFLAQLAAMGGTYLNAAYHEQVTAAWKSTPCTQPGVFRGSSCFAAIGESLGYRLVADSVQLKRDVVGIRLRNVGWAGLYRDYPVRLLFQAEDGRVTAVPLAVSARGWTRDIRLEAPLPALPVGGYRLLLQIGAIALANEDAFDPYLRANLLGTVRMP